MRPLKIGIQLPEAERPVRWDELLTMAQRIEALGFDSLWIGDHLLYRVPGEAPRAPWEAWTLLGALAASTSRVQLGPLVACTSFHSPAMLAKMAATVDEVSGGRLLLGLGAGWHEPEYLAYGFPFDHRASRFEEAFTIIRTLLREGEIDFVGRYYTIRDCTLVPRGPQPQGPPLIVGSFGDRMLRSTLPHVDGWNAWYADYGNTLEGLEALLAKIDVACRAVGRDPATLDRSVAVLIGLTGSGGRLAAVPGERAISPITGGPEAIADHLRAVAARGVGHVQLVLDPITLEAIEEAAAILTVLDS